MFRPPTAPDGIPAAAAEPTRSLVAGRRRLLPPPGAAQVPRLTFHCKTSRAAVPACLSDDGRTSTSDAHALLLPGPLVRCSRAAAGSGGSGRRSQASSGHLGLQASIPVTTIRPTRSPAAASPLHLRLSRRRPSRSTLGAALGSPSKGRIAFSIAFQVLNFIHRAAPPALQPSRDGRAPAGPPPTPPAGLSGQRRAADGLQRAAPRRQARRAAGRLCRLPAAAACCRSVATATAPAPGSLLCPMPWPNAASSTPVLQERAAQDRHAQGGLQPEAWVQPAAARGHG